MVLRRRFIFRGNAAAIGGRIVRPTDVIVDSTAGSSLTVAGGRSHATSGATRFGQFVSIGGAATSAEGLFDNVQQQIQLTLGNVSEDTLTMTTRVHADVKTLIVGDKPKLNIKRLHASLTGKSPAGSGEPPISVGNDTVIEGAAIDKFALVITLATQTFRTYDTLSKLLTAADNAQFVKRYGAQLFMTAAVGGAPAPPTGRLVAAGGTIYATIVRSIKWADRPFPGATIDQHVVTVPNLGKIFFGELLISDMSRRLTMVRLEIGSPIGGAIASAEVETNGSWST
jgi:hypothetical protein